MDGRRQSSALARVSVSFWCRKDRKDYNLWAWKRPWTWNGANEYYWSAECPDCGIKLTRYAMEMASDDPYYKLSTQRKIEADKLRIDTLQPGQEGFQTHYRQEYENIQKQKEVAETEALNKKKENEKKYKKLLATTNLDTKMAKKIKETYLGK